MDKGFQVENGGFQRCKQTIPDVTNLFMVEKDNTDPRKLSTEYNEIDMCLRLNF